MVDLLPFKQAKTLLKDPPKNHIPIVGNGFESVFNSYQSKPRPRSGKPLAKSTLKPYGNTPRILEDYEKYLGARLSFPHIN